MLIEVPEFLPQLIVSLHMGCRYDQATEMVNSCASRNFADRIGRCQSLIPGSVISCAESLWNAISRHEGAAHPLSAQDVWVGVRADPQGGQEFCNRCGRHRCCRHCGSPTNFPAHADAMATRRNSSDPRVAVRVQPRPSKGFHGSSLLKWAVGCGLTVSNWNRLQ